MGLGLSSKGGVHSQVRSQVYNPMTLLVTLRTSLRVTISCDQNFIAQDLFPDGRLRKLSRARVNPIGVYRSVPVVEDPERFGFEPGWGCDIQPPLPLKHSPS